MESNKKELIEEGTSSRKMKKKVRHRNRSKQPDQQVKEKEVVEAWWVPDKKEKTVPEDELCNVMLRFITKQEQYSIPSGPISIREDADVQKLNNLVSTFLKKAGIVETVPIFEFLIGGKLLVNTVGQHLRDVGSSFEVTSEVEFFERHPPPTPKDNLEHDDWVASVMSCGDWLLTGCYDNTVHIWSASGMEKGRGKRAHKLAVPAHNAPVKAVAWLETESDTKTFVSCSIDQRAMVWEWDCELNIARKAWECRGHSQSIECLGVSQDDLLFATGSWDTTVKVWSGDFKSKCTEHDDEEEPDAKKVKKSGSRLLKTPVMTFAGHSESVSGVNWVDKVHLVTCSWDHSIRLWDVEMGGMVSQISGNVSFFSLSFSPLNGTLLAGCADRHIRLYDPRANEGSLVLNKYQSHSKWVPSVRWSPSNENLFVSGSFDKSIKVWDRRSSQSSLYDLLGHNDKVMAVDWSCSRHIASGSADCTAQIYDT